MLQELELQSLIALSYYPNLKDINIRFQYSNISTTMQCRPTFCSVFKKAKHREYIIYVNNNKKFEGGTIDSVPFNAQIGIISHELAHVVDYEKLTSYGIIKRGLSYLTLKTKSKYEYYIDEICIKEGLGWQLYDWSDFELNRSKATRRYKEFKRKIYMSPFQIEQIILNHQIYKYCR